MLEKKNQKRITLKGICSTKWFIKNYRMQKDSKAYNVKCNSLSTADINSCTIKQPKCRKSVFKKLSQLASFCSSFEDLSEGAIQKNVYDIQPKFLDSNNYLGSSAALTQSPLLNDGALDNISHSNLIPSELYLGVN